METATATMFNVQVIEVGSYGVGRVIHERNTPSVGAVNEFRRDFHTDRLEALDPAVNYMRFSNKDRTMLVVIQW